MTAHGWDALEDVFAAPPSLTAEAALLQIRDLLADDASPDDVRGVVVAALARIDMMRRSRPARQSARKRRWLGKVTSFAFPRTFSTGPLPKTDDVAVLLAAGRRHHHVCFTVQITDGTKNAVGREVEVQIQADEAMKLGPQMVRIATALLPAAVEGEQTPPSEGVEVT